MNQWLVDHYQAVLAWSSPFLAVWAWFSARSGQIRKAYRTIRAHFHLHTQNRNLTAQLAEAQQLAASATTRAEQAETERDILAKQLQPPERRPELEDHLLILAASKRRVCWNTLTTERGEHRVTSQFHLQQLLDAGLLKKPSDQSPYCHLTHAGNTYLVHNGLVPIPEASNNAPANN